MPIALERNPTLADAMILVAATATAMASIQGLEVWEYDWRRIRDVDLVVNLAFTLFGLVLTSLTVSVLAIRLRRPRPPLRRLGRQPGFGACLAATIGLGVIGIFLTVPGPNAYSRLPPGLRVNTVAFPCIGAAVGASWAVMAVGGRWRPCPSWIDRAGRAIGVLWIIVLGSYRLGLATQHVSWEWVWR